MVKLVDEKGKDIILGWHQCSCALFLTADAIVNIEDGAEVGVGDVIARIPQEHQKQGILPVVYHVLRIYLKPVNQKIQQSWLKYLVW